MRKETTGFCAVVHTIKFLPLKMISRQRKGAADDVERQVKKMREEHGLSQAALADRLHVTRQAVSKWENGRAVPGIDILTELSALYGMSLWTS